jgi:hypothetical protein
MGNLRTACAMTIAIAHLNACSSNMRSSASSGANGFTNATHSHAVTSSNFKRIAAWGPKGKRAVAHCPRGYTVIAGGSSSSDGSFVGTGHPTTPRDGWIVKPSASARAESFATCASAAVWRTNFRWGSGKPASGIAAAQCRAGYTLITGYGMGTVKASWFDPSTNTYWVTGGGTAHASCVRSDAGVLVKHAWNQSQGPKDVYAGCGSGYTVIAGSMGGSEWPGPPIQEHPGAASAPSAHGYRGWWAFSNATNALTWAACVRT